MGQQQLLLVILVTIIVGIATVVAINTFGSAAENATLDAVRQDLAQIAASAQAYYMKPQMLGGGGNTFTGITFNDFAFPGNVASDTEASNENGSYTLVPGGAGEFTVEAIANVADSTSITARVCPDNLVMGQPGVAPGACP